MTTAPILAYPRADGSEFILDTDASAYAIGAVLSQIQEGKERVIAYGSRTLDKPERNYCVTRREMLAVVYFTKYFKHYLLGRKFIVRTDHGSLTWLQNFKEPDGQIHRWIQQLSQFHMKIEHRPGNRHGNADAMSRLKTDNGVVCKQCMMPWSYVYTGPTKSEIINMKEGENKVGRTVDAISDNDDEISEAEQTAGNVPSPKHKTTFRGDMSGQDVSGETPTLRRGRKPNRPKPAKPIEKPKIDLTLDSIRGIQGSDPVLKEILKFKEDGEKPNWTDISHESNEIKFWVAKWESLEVKEGILCMYWEDNVVRNSRWKICIPNSIVKSILWYMHDSKTAGHVGIKKTFANSKSRPFIGKACRIPSNNMLNSVKFVANVKIHQIKNVIYFNPM